VCFHQPIVAVQKGEIPSTIAIASTVVYNRKTTGHSSAELFWHIFAKSRITIKTQTKPFRKDHKRRAAGQRFRSSRFYCHVLTRNNELIILIAKIRGRENVCRAVCKHKYEMQIQIWTKKFER